MPHVSALNEVQWRAERNDVCSGFKTKKRKQPVVVGPDLTDFRSCRVFSPSTLEGNIPRVVGRRRVLHFYTGGKAGLFWRLGYPLNKTCAGVFSRLPQPLCQLVVPFRHKKIPDGGLGNPFRGCRHFTPEASSPSSGHRGQIRVQIRMEGGIVVVDGTVGVLQAVTGQHADNRCSAGPRLALEQTGNGCRTGRFADPLRPAVCRPPESPHR